MSRFVFVLAQEIPEIEGRPGDTLIVSLGAHPNVRLIRDLPTPEGQLYGWLLERLADALLTLDVETSERIAARQAVGAPRRLHRPAEFPPAARLRRLK